MTAYRHATHREPCTVCEGIGEVPPFGLNVDRPTLSEVTGEWLICTNCLGVGYFYVTRQPAERLKTAV